MINNFLRIVAGIILVISVTACKKSELKYKGSWFTPEGSVTIEPNGAQNKNLHELAFYRDDGKFERRAQGEVMTDGRLKVDDNGTEIFLKLTQPDQIYLEYADTHLLRLHDRWKPDDNLPPSETYLKYANDPSGWSKHRKTY